MAAGQGDTTLPLQIVGVLRDVEYKIVPNNVRNLKLTNIHIIVAEGMETSVLWFMVWSQCASLFWVLVEFSNIWGKMGI